MDRTRVAGVALVVASTIGFSSGGFFARGVYAASVDWLTLMTWRFVIAGAVAWIVLAARPSSRRALRALPRRTALIAALLGILYVTHTSTYYAGITTVPLGLAALVVYLYPPLVAVLAVRAGRPLDGRRAWVALAMAVAGVALAVGGIDPGSGPPLAGLVLIVASPILYSAWIVLAARSAGERRDRTAHASERGATTTVAGAVMLSATGASYVAISGALGHPFLPGTIPAAAWPGILGVALVAGYVAVQAFSAGSQRIGAAEASLVSTVEPLWTIGAAALILGEQLTPVQVAGGALILGGVVLAQARRRAAIPAAP